MPRGVSIQLEDTMCFAMHFLYPCLALKSKFIWLFKRPDSQRTVKVAQFLNCKFYFICRGSQPASQFPPRCPDCPEIPIGQSSQEEREASHTYRKPYFVQCAKLLCSYGVFMCSMECAIQPQPFLLSELPGNSNFPMMHLVNKATSIVKTGNKN